MSIFKSRRISTVITPFEMKLEILVILGKLLFKFVHFQIAPFFYCNNTVRNETRNNGDFGKIK